MTTNYMDKEKKYILRGLILEYTWHSILVLFLMFLTVFPEAFGYI